MQEPVVALSVVHTADYLNSGRAGRLFRSFLRRPFVHSNHARVVNFPQPMLTTNH